jgi:DNA-binding HxlR family transcriptional regulator
MSKNEFEFPPIIKKAVSGMDNELRWKILESFVNKGDMSHSRLMAELKVTNKGILNFHLKNLSKSALIERYEDLSNKTSDRSFYTISDIGKNIINGLMSALGPNKKKAHYFGVYDTSAIKQWTENFELEIREQEPLYSVSDSSLQICPPIGTS